MGKRKERHFFPELIPIFEELNEQYFDNQLPFIKLSYSDKDITTPITASKNLKTEGIFWRKKRIVNGQKITRVEIVINSVYFMDEYTCEYNGKKFFTGPGMSELKMVLGHELTHYFQYLCMGDTEDGDVNFEGLLKHFGFRSNNNYQVTCDISKKK